MRILRWSLLALSAAAVVAGLFAHGLFEQQIWTPLGLARLAWFSAAALGLMLALSCSRRWVIFMRGSAPTALAATAGYAAAAVLVSLLAPFPVNTPALYWVLLLLPWGAFAMAMRYAKFSGPVTRGEAIAQAVLLSVLWIHLAGVCKPEVSADGLAMHLVVPARLAQTGRWAFDVTQFAWAVMPMGGDWFLALGYLTGGEYGARLLNFAALALIVSLLASHLRTLLPAWGALTLAAAYASIPLLQLTTASLMVENFYALAVLTAYLFLKRYRAAGQLRDALAAALCCGAAMQTKFGGILIALILLGALAWSARRRPLTLAAALALALAAGAVPYAHAWLRTGNPVFPFYNNVFQSPFFDAAQPLRDLRFHEPLTWRTLYDLTFFSQRFMESQAGSFGFLVLLTLPVALTAAAGSGALALALSLGGGVLLLAAVPNLRYLAAVLPLYVLWLGHAFSRLPRAMLYAVAALIPLQVYFLASSSWYHKDLLYVSAAERRAYVEREVPGLLLARQAGHATLAFLEETPVGGYPGRVYTNTWHSGRCYQRLRNAASEDEVAAVLHELGVEYVVSPAPHSRYRFSTVHVPAFLTRYTVVQRQLGDWILARCRWSASAHEPGYAPPGTYDDLNPYAEYRGPWTRDLQFKEAAQGTLVYTDHPGDSVVFRFEGAAVAVVFTRAANRGQAAVTIDGRPASALDERGARSEWQARQRWAGLGPGRHEMIIRVSGPGFIDIDAFVVEE